MPRNCGRSAFDRKGVLMAIFQHITLWMLIQWPWSCLFFHFSLLRNLCRGCPGGLLLLFNIDYLKFTMWIKAFPRIYDWLGIVAHSDEEPTRTITPCAFVRLCKSYEHIFINTLGCLFHNLVTTIIIFKHVLVCSVRVLYHCCFHCLWICGATRKPPRLIFRVFEIWRNTVHEVPWNRCQ